MFLTKKIKYHLNLITKKRDNLTFKLIKTATSSFGVKISAVGFSFIASLILARLLGTTKFGIYTYAISWATLLSIPATLGLDKLLIREVSVFVVRSEWRALKGILSWTNLVVLITSLGLVGLAGVAAGLIYYSSNSLTAWAIWVALIALPIQSLRGIRVGAMRGLNKVVLAMIPELLVSPILIIFALSTWQLLKGENNSVLWILVIRVVAITISYFLGVKYLYQAIPPQIKQISAEYKASTWLRSSLPFMFLGVTQIINAQGDVLMLGAIKGVEVVGIYGIVSKISIMVVFIQGAANNALEPIIASFYAENKIAKLKQLVIRSTRMVLLVSFVILNILILFGQRILSFFGPDFIVGYEPLMILTIGQFLNAAIGPVGLLLNMTGHEKITAISVSCSAILNIILNALLIPQWGINGAAIATATSIVISNFVNMLLVSQKLKISPIILDAINPKISK